MSRIAIIGGGAAGCFAAANVPEGHSVQLFEKTGKLLQKVKVSGGGRCNVTHACFEIPELIRRYPRGQSLLKRSLHRFGPQQTIDWFQERGVKIKEEADGRMFPVSDDSQSVIDAIVAAMNRRGVVISLNKSLTEIYAEDGSWVLRFADTSSFSCDKILLAPGSLLKPEQWSWLKKLGHTIQEPAPSLFTFNLPGNAITSLMGVAVPNATVRLTGTRISQQGPLLITHWGMSGPAVLKTSAWAARYLQEQQYGARYTVNWLGDVSEPDCAEQLADLRQYQGKAQVGQRNPFGLPRRLWDFFLERAQIAPETRWAELSSAARQKLQTALVADPYEMRGKTTFKEEFVTCGGITLTEVNPQTMESRIAPGLFFAGEALDVDGITGGYNFQHAWSSGWIAAQNMVL
jgi:predicted Rossmann fold flavoprotein